MLHWWLRDIFSVQLIHYELVWNICALNTTPRHVYNREDWKKICFIWVIIWLLISWRQTGIRKDFLDWIYVVQNSLKLYEEKGRVSKISHFCSRIFIGLSFVFLFKHDIVNFGGRWHHFFIVAGLIRLHILCLAKASVCYQTLHANHRYQSLLSKTTSQLSIKFSDSFLTRFIVIELLSLHLGSVSRAQILWRQTLWCDSPCDVTMGIARETVLPSSTIFAF